MCLLSDIGVAYIIKMKRSAFKCWDASIVHRAACFSRFPLKHGLCPHQHLTDKLRIIRERSNTKAPLCRMLLSVCMKDYVARSYGHTPRKLPLKGVPLRATSRFIAYQALLLYIIFYRLSILLLIFGCPYLIFIVQLQQ